MTGKELGKQPVFPIIMPPPNEQGFYGNVHDYGLTKREVEVLCLVAKGFTNAEIANLIHISDRTVATHLRHVYEKTGSANRAEASAYAIREELAES